MTTIPSPFDRQVCHLDVKQPHHACFDVGEVGNRSFPQMLNVTPVYVKSCHSSHAGPSSRVLWRRYIDRTTEIVAERSFEARAAARMTNIPSPGTVHQQAKASRLKRPLLQARLILNTKRRGHGQLVLLHEDPQCPSRCRQPWFSGTKQAVYRRHIRRICAGQRRPSAKRQRDETLCTLGVAVEGWNRAVAS